MLQRVKHFCRGKKPFKHNDTMKKYATYWSATALTLSLVFALVARAMAQCERIGRVISADLGCGAKVIDLLNSKPFIAVSGAEALPEGKVFRFSAQPSALPAGCVSALATMALTCVSDTLPCKADFSFAVSPQNAFQLFFEAQIFDPNTQKCYWDFGDGSTAEGASVQHTFAQEGYYTVCLTLTAPNGCYTQQCRPIWVSALNSNSCGYEVQLTAVGTKLHGQLVPVNTFAPKLTSVRWYMAKTNLQLSTAPTFTAALPGPGNYYVCVQYETEKPSCVATYCQMVSITTSECIMPALAQLTANQICPSAYSPVCGCNGITYPNECAAMAAGISQWWAGECGTQSGSCAADFKVEVLTGNPASGYWVRFLNRSAGSYQVLQLDFGDGSPIWVGSAADTVIEHHYAKSGVYRTNLTVWRNNQCVSSLERILATDAAAWKSAPPLALTDYVFPGDANGDRKANVYDLLPLGLTFARTGPPRPFANTSWSPQFAPNWSAADLVSTVNLKHSDTDGNGVINEFDRAAIEKNYSPIEDNAHIPSAASVPIWLRFAEDSLLINPQNPNPVSISAEIRVGHVSDPVFQLYGLAFGLKYPEYILHDPEVLYSNTSFFGVPGDVLLLPKDIYSRRQMDLGFARKNGQAVSGYGTIARINFSTDFVIIIDVIERTGSLRIPFTVPVIGVRGVNAIGQPVALRGAVLDTLWLVLQPSVSTTEAYSGPQVVLYPNPATTEAWVAVGDATLERVEVFDILGRRVAEQRPTGSYTTRLDTSSWRKGTYTVRLFTSAGIAERRLIVH